MHTVLHVRGVHTYQEPKNTIKYSSIIDIVPQSTIEENIDILTNHDHLFVLFDGHGPEVGETESGLALYYTSNNDKFTMTYLRRDDITKGLWNDKIFFSTA